MDMDKEQIAQELIRRGVPPERLAAAGYGQVAQQARTGLIAPKLEAPDPVAARGAYLSDYKRLSERREGLGKYASNLGQLDRFQQLNRNQRTGGIQHQDYQGWELANPANLPGIIGNAVAKFDPEVQEMSGIASGLQGQARPIGSGATSDFEQRLYRMGVPSPEKRGPVNDNIIRYQKGVIAEERDRTAFDEEFMRRNGSLSGASEAWARYTQTNPYIVTDNKGRTNLNGKRQDWREYFGLQAPQKPAGGQGQGAGQPKRPPVPPAARNAHTRLMKAGTITGQGQFGTQQNPFVAVSPQMLERLPKGSYVIDPQGNFGVIE